MVHARMVAFAVVVIAAAAGAARAQSASPPPAAALEFRFTPTARTQLAIWIEKPDGTFLKTVALTQSVGLYGIGNRPGAAQMNSGFRWPYGRREGVLPIWAHRRLSAPGATMFRRVIFQDRQSEGFASRTSNDSSPDTYFCLSFSQASTPEGRRQDAIDAVTCASANRFMSDKGRFVTDADLAGAYAEPAVIDGMGVMRPLDATSLYPPRRDVKACPASDPGCNADRPDVAGFDDHVHQVMPDIDTITMATPPPDVEHAILFTVPPEWPDGDYVAWIEANVEGDYNATFNDQTLPTPRDPVAKWDTWAINSGYPYRGQPSVAYQVPFTLGPSGSATAAAPAFYGDVDGFGAKGGDLHPIDGLITDDPVSAAGQGADRLRLVAPSGHRVQVTVRGRDLCAAQDLPAPPSDFTATPLTDDPKNSHQWGQLRFVIPPSTTPIVQYQVRFSADPIVPGDGTTFDRALPAVAATAQPEALSVPAGGSPGSEVLVRFGGLRPLTRYFVAIRAVDMCNVAGPFVVADMTTTRINFTQLSGCFIATAAYGTSLAPRVQALRAARDALRPRSALFSLATDLYYRSGPAAAAVISRSAVTRAVVRGLLSPVADVTAGALAVLAAPAAAGARPVVTFSR